MSIHVSKKYKEDYFAVQEYAEAKGLENTLIALPMVQRLVDRESFKKVDVFHDPFRFIDEYEHSLSISRMLIDLNIPVTKEEEDIILATAICHNLPEIMKIDNLEEMLTVNGGLDPEVYNTVNLVYWRDNITRTEKKKLYKRIQENKLAAMVRLADRSLLVAQLHALPNWGAHRYLEETRTYFFPVCLYAKEHYPDIAGPVSILMEKMRNLLAVEEILLKRYEARENEMSQEILALREENTTIKAIIARMKANREKEDNGEDNNGTY